MGRSKWKKENRKKECSSWIRVNRQETSFTNKYREAKKAIQKSKKEPLSSVDLLKILHKRKNFIGIFASDQLSSLCVLNYPVFFITNIDTAAGSGSHWIAIKITKNVIEIFDSLGFNPTLWDRYPEKLFNFLNCFSITHRVVISPVLQAPNNHNCGLYSIFFILYRSLLSFRSCYTKLSSDLTKNSSKLHTLLLNFFKK